MASLRRIHNLSNTALSWSSAAPLRNNVKHNKNSRFSLRVRVVKIPSVGHSVCGVRCFISNNSNKEVEKRNINHDRLYLNRRGSLKPGIVGGWRGDFVSRKTFVVTREGPVDLSLEPSFVQVSGEVEQESDAVSCESFPRTDYHSAVATPPPPHVHSPVSSDEPSGVMSELEDALGFPLGQGPQSPNPKPLVIVISGPSGVGKDAVIKKLQFARRDIHFVVTATTRPMRPGEVDGLDYYFMSKTEFQEMIENHELLEHAIVYGDYKGIPKQQVREYMSQGMDVVLRVDVQGAATVRSILGSEAVFIFLVAESEAGLVKRLVERKTETMEKMLIRVATAREELTRMEEFDYVVENKEGCLDKTVSLICSIIDAEKSRVRPKAAQL